jgi:hypothetical protein
MELRQTLDKDQSLCAEWNIPVDISILSLLVKWIFVLGEIAGCFSFQFIPMRFSFCERNEGTFSSIKKC